MRSNFHQRATRTTLRRRQLKQELAQLTGIRPPLRSLQDLQNKPSPPPRLAQVLPRLGPIFSACGIYLATRIDLLVDDELNELSELADLGSQTPIDLVEKQIRRELGAELEAVFSSFEAEPFECRLLLQSHQARLLTGQRVLVKLVHPKVAKQLEEDLEALPLLIPALVQRVRSNAQHGPEQVGEALEDFRNAIERAVDLDHELQSVTTLSEDTNLSEYLHLPKPWRDLSTTCLTVYEDNQASRPLLNSKQKNARTSGYSTSPETKRAIRQLTLGWLHQVIASPVFALEPRAENIWIAPDLNPVFMGSVFVKPAAGWREPFWCYLLAVAAHDPKRACGALIGNLIEAPPQSHADLERRFRQVLPRRDGSSRVRVDHLAEYLLLHWQVINDLGCQPSPTLIGFFRGLQQIQAVARDLVPETDLFSEAVQTLQIRDQLTQLQRWMNPVKLTPDLQALFYMQIPQKLDTILKNLSEGDLRVRFEIEEGPADRRRRFSPLADGVLISTVFLGGCFIPIPSTLEESVPFFYILASGIIFGKLIFRN